MTNTDTSSPFRGPSDRFHFPRHTKDCWRGRPAGCCLVCKARLVRQVVRR